MEPLLCPESTVSLVNGIVDSGYSLPVEPKVMEGSEAGGWVVVEYKKEGGV